MNITTRLFRAGIILSSFWMAAGFAVAQAGETAEPSAQTPAVQITRDQLTAAAKRYFRDSTELPLVQQTEFSVFDPSGHPRKTEKLTRDYLFKGYSPRSESANGTLGGANVSFWSVMRGNRLVKASYNGAGWTMAPGVLARSLSSVPLEITSTKDEDGSVLVRLSPKGVCQPFTMQDHWNAERYIPDGVCSTAVEFRLDRDLRFQKFTYEAPGLPIPATIYPLGDCTLQRYHTEIEFQATTIPGDAESFLLPKQVTTTLETNKGNVVITSVYEPKTTTKPTAH